MIRNETESRELRNKIDQGRDRLAAFENELRAEGWGPREVARAAAPSLALLSQQEAQLKKYQRVSAGNLSDFAELRDLGALLTAARIARGFTQRDLGKTLDVHESQISRDERRDYQGVTLERACDIFEALGIRVQIRASIGDAGSRTWLEQQPTIEFTHRAPSTAEASSNPVISVRASGLKRNHPKRSACVA